METSTAHASYAMGGRKKVMSEIIENINNYQQRFNKMYELEYDLCWFDKDVPEKVKLYIDGINANQSLDIKNSAVLDLGCGRGQLLHYLEQQDFHQIIGVDVSSVASKLAKQYAKQSSIVVADVIKGLPFQNNTFSLVTELTLLSSLNPQYWIDILNEIHRVLDRGGFFISEIFTRNESDDLNQPLVTRNVIPRELDQVYGITTKELPEIFGRQFSIKKYQSARRSWTKR